jgi:small conductance mechanosensitive channel
MFAVGTRKNLLILVALSVAAATAMFGAEDGDPQVSRGAELLERLLQYREEIQQLQADVEEAEGEDRLVAERRQLELRIEMLQSFNELVDNIATREEAGKDAVEERRVVEEAFGTALTTIRKWSDAHSQRLDELRAERESAQPAALMDIERRIAKEVRSVDFALEILLDVVRWMERLGLDPSAERTHLVDALSQRAENLAVRIELAIEEEDGLRIRSADDPDNAELAERARAAESRRETGTESLAATVGLMKSLEMESAEYRGLLMRATGQVTTDVLSSEVALTIFQTWWQRISEWVAEKGPGILFQLTLFVLILLLFRALAGLARRIARRALERSTLNVSQLLRGMIVRFLFNAVLLLGLLVGLSQLGVSLGPLLAGLGVVGFIIGFALQDTLGNFASGMMILLYRPFDVGDFVEAAGISGTVRSMSLVSTTILTFDNQTIVVPNNKIWGDVIKNVTVQKQRRVDMVFGISYDDDIPRAENVLRKILAEHDRVLDDPEPVVRLHKLGESSVDFVVRPWVRTEDYWDVYWDVTREVKMRFDREGISIPFPHRSVQLVQQATDDVEE